MLLRWTRRSWLKATLATAGAALPASSLIATQDARLFGAEPWQTLPVAQPTPSLVPEQLCRRVVLEMSLKPYRKLDDATVHFLTETETDPIRVTFAVNNVAITNTKFHPVTIEDDGRRVVGRGITGELVVSW